MAAPKLYVEVRDLDGGALSLVVRDEGGALAALSLARPPAAAPEPSPPLGARLWALGVAIFPGALAALMSLILASFAYKAIIWSSETLATPLHLVLLAVACALVGLGLYAIATPERRARHSEAIYFWFGERALWVMPPLLMLTAAACFASVTHHLTRVAPGLFAAPFDGAVPETRLLDFYVWHFLDLAPFIRINDLLLWERPLEHQSGWVGVIILLFQAAVVFPVIAALRAARAADRKP